MKESLIKVKFKNFIVGVHLRKIINNIKKELEKIFFFGGNRDNKYINYYNSS